MESILWACNLLAVLYACRWALRTDVAEAKEEEQQKKMGQG